MTFRVRIRASARDDIREAFDWYDHQSAGLGDRFVGELDHVFERLTTDPRIYQVVHKEVRRALTRRFPYGIYYLIDDDRVNILRVLHLARDPMEFRR
ncbi:MAG TPA: type II toxin-antitoxin system RelE/ParE family toxin [Thermoanaerobaculia bacterium]|nr:type II toxin-antitoxin system RelE/ParE family toxin [Thermoanaerobaculia bacterium]